MEHTANLRSAIADGVLIDVSHLATKIGLLCPTFVTSAFWNSVEIHRSEVILTCVLDTSCPVHDLVGNGEFATASFGVSGGPTARWGIGVTALVDYFEGIGTVVILGDFEEELDFRAPRSPGGGSFYTV